MYMDGSYHQGECAPLPEKSQLAAIQAVDAATLRAILRGELPIEALETTSIRIGCYGAKTAPTALRSLRIGARDIAEGLAKVNDDPVRLAEWARFVLVASEHFAFEDEKSDYADRLVACIWNLAFGAPLDPSALRLIQAARVQLKAA